MNKHAQLAKNTLLIGISKMSTFLSLIILLPIMTAKLSGGDYGFLDLIMSYGSLIVPVMVLALDQGAWRLLMDGRDDEGYKKTVISTVIFTIAPVFVVLSAVYFALATYLKYNLTLELFLYMVSLMSVSITTYIQRGLGNNKQFAIGGVIQNIANIAGVIIALLCFDAGLGGILIAYAVSGFLASVYNLLFGKMHKYMDAKSVDRKMRKNLLLFSLPSIPNSISWWILGVSDRTILSVILGTAANGIYAVSNKFASFMGAVQGVFGMAWMESAALNYTKDDNTRDTFFSSVFNKQFRVFGAFALALVATTGVSFSLLVDPEYWEGYLYVPVLVFAGLISTIVGFYSGVYFARKMQKKTMMMSMQTAVINLVVNLGLVWFIGVWAAAISTLVAYLAMAVYRHYDMKKYVKITYERGIFLKIFIFFAVVSALYYMGNFWANVGGLVVAVTAGIWLNYDLIKKPLAFGIKWLSAHRERSGDYVR